MKKRCTVFILVMLTAITTRLFGQIPNYGFENWNNMGNYWNPVGWWTPNDSVQTGTFYPVTRSTDHYPAAIGSYSLRLENNMTLLPDWGAYGITWTGDFSGNNYPVFPILGHPESLWGYFKFSPQNNDTMEVHIRLYKNGIDVGGGGFKNAAPVTVWTPFTINFSTYLDADSARIMMSTCYDNDAPIPHGNSILFIDNLSFDSLITVGMAEDALEKALVIYPNPANEILTISYSEAAGKLVDLTVYNVFGQGVLKEHFSAISSPFVFDISQLDEGIYIVSLINYAHQTLNKKILILR